MERNKVELRRIYAITHMATISAPEIDRVVAEMRRTPFKSRIANIGVHNVGNIKFPKYKEHRPNSHVRDFRLDIIKGTPRRLRKKLDNADSSR